MLQVDFELFFMYVERLQQIGLISKGDASRIVKSLTASGIGFVAYLFKFRDDILQGLKTGTYVSSESTRTVFKHRNSHALPIFLGVMTSKVFDAESGTLLSDFCTDAVAELLQLLSALKKTTPKGSYAKRLQAKVWNDLIENHSAYKDHFAQLSRCFDDPVDTAIWKRTSYWLNEFLSFETPDINPDLYPVSFGPGSNFEKVDATYSSDWWVPYSTSRETNPFIKRFVESGIADIRRNCFGVEHDSRNGARLIGRVHHRMRCSVQPKSFKAFRGVGVSAALKMSLALRWKNAFYANLPEGLPLTDQRVMAEVLRKNFWEVGTIDLSAASDRLWWPMILSLLEGNPHVPLLKFLRTQMLDFPDGTAFHSVTPLMGEAITFPLISAFFLAVCYAVSDVIFGGEGKDLVRVYGDDIITPHYYTVLAVLQRIFGAKPSWDKSYGPESHFKESCEAHYVAKNNIVPVNVKPRYLFTSTFKDYKKDARNVQRSPSSKRTRVLRHIDVIRLLDIADASFKTSPTFSTAICDFIELYSKHLLARTNPGTGQYGRPTSGSCNDWREHVIALKKGQEDKLSLRGLLRSKLRAIGQSSREPADYRDYDPAARKVVYTNLARAGARLRTRDTFQGYVQQIIVTLRPTWHSLDDKSRENLFQYAYRVDPLLRESSRTLLDRIIYTHLLSAQ